MSFFTNNFHKSCCKKTFSLSVSMQFNAYTKNTAFCVDAYQLLGPTINKYVGDKCLGNGKTLPNILFV